MEKDGILYFHQGWTDIINCLGLINYYSEKYDTIFLIVRTDAQNLINYYVNGLKNIKLVYLDKKFLSEIQPGVGLKNTKNLLNITKNLYKVSNNNDLLYHGGHDLHRKDQFINHFNTSKKAGYFSEKFYTIYNIPYINRINYFNFIRNHDIENKIYNDFVKKNGKEYILYHKIIKNYDKSKKIINLAEISNTFFDYIKVLENSIEIHLLDSVWGAIVYHLDCKYKLFQDKKIFLYTNRGHGEMFRKPIKLDNWKII